MIFLPGVCQQHSADVIRGEELQIFGACAEAEEAMLILQALRDRPGRTRLQ